MDCSHDNCKRPRNHCGKSRPSPLRQRGFLGAICILAGVLVMLLFVPGWLIAILLAFLLFSLGLWFLGCR